MKERIFILKSKCIMDLENTLNFSLKNTDGKLLDIKYCIDDPGNMSALIIYAPTKSEDE